MESILNNQKKYFELNETKSYQFRITQLKKLKDAILKHEQEIIDALHHDLGKSTFEAYTTEIGFCLSSIRKTMKHLKKWMKPKRVKTPIFIPFTSSFIMPEPLGNILILGPYNYPFQLVIEPLIGAIASGNTAVIKPSEFTTETEKIIKKMINENFNENYLHVVTGNHIVAGQLASLPFDHIFFTGSTKVGQIVYEQASKNLVPVTLELGGKSPTIVDETARIDHAAKRIVFGKFINAGQTCIAPDYIYAHASIKNALIEALKKYIQKFYQNEATGKIVSKRHFDRLNLLIDPKKVAYGNQKDANNHIISPTILDDVSWNDDVMQEEIFGPILPILTYENLNDVMDILHKKDEAVTK